MDLIETTYEKEKLIAKEHCIFRTLTGSRLYGTFMEDSDYDYKGVAIPPKEYFFGLRKFEQFEDRETDNVIYNIKKAVGLMVNNNPNMMDMLFAPKDFWDISDPIWNNIYDVRYMFLSNQVKRTFTSYAAQQLKRMESHKSWLTKKPAKPEKPESTDNTKQFSKAILSIPEKFLTTGLHEQVKAEKTYQKELADYKAYNDHMEKRNPERLKTEMIVGYDTKHAMHIIRLLKQSKEIFETGEVIVNRTGIDADELLEIRQGKWKYETIIELARDLQSDIDTLYLTSQFPETPDRHKVEKLLVGVMEEYFYREKS
jgi:hypothetical protein